MAATALVLALYGVVCIHSAGLHDSDASAEWRKQLIYIGIGVVLMALFASIDYHRWQRWAFGLYAANFFLLGLVLVGGRSALGAQRWINLGPIQFQPSEPAKLILAIAIAALVSRSPSVGWREVGAAVLAVAIPALLILKQPDLGTALVIFAILSAELFFGVSKMAYFAAYIAVTIALGAFVVGTKYVLKPFQRNRLLVFLHPEADPPAGISINRRSRSAAAASSAKASSTEPRRSFTSYLSRRAISCSR